MHDQEIGEFLFRLPKRPLTREEKVQLIKKAIQHGDVMSQDRLDQVMARLLEEIQTDG